MVTYGKERINILLTPVSGKALPVYRGEVMRIVQEGGGQCVDFNCYNLHNHKEYMNVGYMRNKQAFRIRKGDFVMSGPPYESILMSILEMPDTCITDLLGSRCSAGLYEARFGLTKHTNCQDTFTECIGEYGLAADDTHDSFNMWMNTGWTDEGNYLLKKNTGKKGDFVDLLAVKDVLAVPIVCGSGDLMMTCNSFSYEPLRVHIFAPSQETESLVQEYISKYAGMVNQRSVDDFRIKTIRTERELTADPNYKPNFINYPIKYTGFDIELSEEDAKNVDRLIDLGMANSAEAIIRSAAMLWYGGHMARPHPHGMKPRI